MFGGILAFPQHPVADGCCGSLRMLFKSELHSGLLKYSQIKAPAFNNFMFNNLPMQNATCIRVSKAQFKYSERF